MSEGTPAQPTGDRLPIDPDLRSTTAIGPDSFAPATPSRPRRWDVALVIAAGGALGGGARWLVNQALPTGSDGFPWSTFVENVTGCFLLAAIMVFLLDTGQAGLALTYLFASVAVGLLAVVAGLSLTRRLAGVTPPHQRNEPS